MGVELALEQLLRAPVEVSDVGLRVHDPLPVYPEDHAEDAVSGGVLRPHVDHDVQRFERARFRQCRAFRSELWDDACVGQRQRAPKAAARGGVPHHSVYSLKG